MNPWFYTLNFLPLSRKCSNTHLSTCKHISSSPFLFGHSFGIVDAEYSILELRYNAHFGSSNWTKSSLIINMNFQGFWGYFQCFFFFFFLAILIRNWSQLDLIVLAELQTAWNKTLDMRSCLCIAGNMNILVCFLWFSHLSD